jgi:hypothetical protein
MVVLSGVAGACRSSTTFESAGQGGISPDCDLASASCQTADVLASTSFDATPLELLWSGEYVIAVRGAGAVALAPHSISLHGR